MSENENDNYDKSESHRYWANSAGFIAFCVMLIFLIKSCDNTIQNREDNAKEIEIHNGK